MSLNKLHQSHLRKFKYLSVSKSATMHKLSEKVMVKMHIRPKQKNQSVISHLKPKKTVLTRIDASLNYRASFGTKKSIDFKPKSSLSNRSKISITTY